MLSRNGGKLELGVNESMNNLAFTWKGQGRDEEAIRLIHECVSSCTHVLGARHHLTLSSANIGLVESRKTSLVCLLANENIRHCLHEIAPASRDTTCISADRVPPPRRTILIPVPAFQALFATFGMIGLGSRYLISDSL
jgi:hypothetical protein